jgi:heme/copper-type cytochrome/quinol oxidase subunit 2
METENPQQPQQPNQQGGNYNPYHMPVDNSVMSVGDWVITMLIVAIPLVGIVMLFIWAFGDNTNQNKANFAKAYLIWIAISIALVIMVYAVFFSAIMALAT